MRECNATVWDQPWTHTRRLTDFQCADKNVDAKQRDKTRDRQNELVGSAMKLDHETKEARVAANFAVEEMNARTNSLYRLMLLDILSVHRQVADTF